MVSTRARSLENQPESSTTSNDHNARLQQLNDQIREREQQLAILHAQQRLNELEAQIREDTFIESRPTPDIAAEPPQNRPVDDMDDDNETPPRLEIKDYYRGKNMLEFKDYKDRMLTLFARHRRYYRKEERKINDAKLYLDAHVKQKWLNFVSAYERRGGATPLTFDDMLSHLEMQINDPQNQRRLASQRFQDAKQQEWQSIRDFSKYLEDWEHYLPPYSEEQRMDNLRSKALKVLRTELDRRNQEPQNYEELLRTLQTLEENMPERRRAIRKGRPAIFTTRLRDKHLLAMNTWMLTEVGWPMAWTVKSYGQRKAAMKIIDDEHVLREGFHHFEEADISGYDVILGMPWLQAANPDIDWVRRCWTYRKASNISHVHLDTAKEFATLMDDSNIIFAAFPLRAAHAATEPNIPDDYKDYLDVFREDIPDAEHAPHDHAIDLKPGKEPPYRPIYNLSPQELSVLREYIEKALEKNWIRPSKSPAGAPVLFAPKKDGTLRLCVDYRGLNEITVKNRYPLPLISEILDRLAGAKIYTQLDLRDAYHRIRIRAGDEWKTAFRTRYGHFEYLVLPFGLTNAPATFQSYINKALSDILDVYCVAYLDDIVIYSNTLDEHVAHVKNVLERLRRWRLYVKLILDNNGTPD
ncbi:hypothetical protein HCAG_06047 [Histoplasma mississippiense (nom. inval.)]|uniref:hypothetical protein n=1 Tax=Ajellomyces capsulatus (strain NAm1 / WU24) TaxID=2059318 RepID=UPI000157CB7E|nr:hypothetical protein HCAG_06047 [Histoplasma mississippiense (nom. inval.)]EDN10244.1 hypothetical protein HCAG_06047 [Histoplasma mississippiense (nom. inval.)]